MTMPAAPLVDLQNAFLAQVLDEDAPLPNGWGSRAAAGMAVYRNNYRSSLIDALRATFERTERWVGADAFGRAAAHHVISHPPASWTLDDVGIGFDATCAELFAGDPEVGELAWLEGAMLDIFTAADSTALDAAGFSAATAGFGEDDWAGLRLQFQPGMAIRQVQYDLRAIWQHLADEDASGEEVTPLDQPMACIVWREGERSTFTLVSAMEGRAFAAMQSGATYDELCDMLSDELGIEQAIMQAGQFLGHWLAEGMIVGLGGLEAP